MLAPRAAVARRSASARLAATPLRTAACGLAALAALAARLQLAAPFAAGARSQLGQRWVDSSPGRALLQVRSATATASSSSNSGGGSTSSSSDAFRRDPEKFAAEATELLQEIAEIAVSTGWKAGIQRGLQASKAVAQTLPELLKDLDVPTLLRENKPPDDTVVARSLRRLFERLGATYVKLGQFIASTPTIFPAAYVREFANTLDQTEKVPFSKIKEIVEADLGRPLTAVYSRFDKEPLASASIAQVHTATLRTGEDVVVKVQKPGIEGVLKADLGFIYASVRILQFLAPELGRSSLADIVGDIRESMLGELDFRQEQANLVKFREFLKVNGLDGIATAPLPYPQASSAKVLTMERLRGVPLVDLEGIKAYSTNPEQTLIDALNVWGLSVQLNEFFHADVHSGNLLVLEDGRVGFIDFGIVGRIPPRIWDAVNDLSLGFVKQDEMAMARALIRMGATSGKVDEKKFAEGIGQVLRRLGSLQPELRVRQAQDGAAQAQVTFDESEVTELVLDLVQVAEDGGVKLPREFGLLLKQALYFDRYNKILAPDLDPLRDPRVRMNEGRRGDSTVIDV